MTLITMRVRAGQIDEMRRGLIRVYIDALQQLDSAAQYHLLKKNDALAKLELSRARLTELDRLITQLGWELHTPDATAVELTGDQQLLQDATLSALPEACEDISDACLKLHHRQGPTIDQVAHMVAGLSRLLDLAAHATPPATATIGEDQDDDPTDTPEG